MPTDIRDPVLLDEITRQEINHLSNNQPDLEYQISLIDGELAQIFTVNHKNRRTCERLLYQQIEEQIRLEAVYQAKQRVEDHETKETAGIR